MNAPSTANYIKRQIEEERTGHNATKPVLKTLNRVPRACNACRKQKMRCEGADSPPCKRCRNSNLECLFEKPSREANLTGEAGLERIRSLESHVAEIRSTQNTISNTLSELLSHLRSGSFNSPVYQPSFSVPASNLNSPSNSVVTPTGKPQDMQTEGSCGHNVSHHPDSSRKKTRSSIHASAQPHQSTPADTQSPSILTSTSQEVFHQVTSHVPTLPPFSTISTMGHPYQHTHDISQSYQDLEVAQPSSSSRNRSSGSNRRTLLLPNGASDNMSDSEAGELPASGLVAPWEVLRGLADVATERAAQENYDSSGPQSRERTRSPEGQNRPLKRRKTNHRLFRNVTFPDVVTKNIISEGQARELFNLFYHGCSTFLPVFDSSCDTYDSLHERSPFAVDCICMVAARTRDGAHPSETYFRIQQEVQAISCATLFAPVLRPEAVQAMILVSGWSDNGWLSGGHAVRMAMELSMHKAWPRLLRRIKAKRINSAEDRELVITSRTWFCLYLFEHQLSYGTGRPAVLKDDESIRECRLLLQHPLAIEDDMRLVSTVELMAIRERVNNAIPMEGPVIEEHFLKLRAADEEFAIWYAEWDAAFSRKYEDAAFYRQSLQIQRLHAELFHNATTLRGIDGPDDVNTMPQLQRQLAVRSMQIACEGLDLTVNSPAYREGMKFAVHYTHATATFAASFLLRLARLFPDDCDIHSIRHQVERLSNLLAEIPGRRYALTLQLMLERSNKTTVESHPQPPQTVEELQKSTLTPASGSLSQSHLVPIPPHYENFAPGVNINNDSMTQYRHGLHHSSQLPYQYHHLVPQQHPHIATDAENIWRGLQAATNEQLPVWISDQSLGGSSFTQNGMDAFLLPSNYMHMSAPKIW